MDNSLYSKSASAAQVSERSARLTHKLFCAIDPEIWHLGTGGISIDDSFNIIINALVGVTAAVLDILPPDLDAEAVQRGINEQVTAIMAALPKRRPPPTRH
jgi:hypothetical protein